MIVIVTLNPLLEKKYFCDDFELNKTFRVDKIKYSVGGKGINISRELNYLGVPNQSFTFLGGENGRYIRKLLTHEKINYVAVPTKAQTREAAVIIDKKNNSVSTVMEKKYEISRAEIEEMKVKLEKAILNSNMLVFAGSLPNDDTFEIIDWGTKLAKENDKLVLFDTYGNHLDKSLNLPVDIIHNNVDELEKALNKNLSTEEDIINLAKELKDRGIKISAITNGKHPFIVNNFGFLYKVYPPAVNEIHPTGSGDAFVAGLIYGIFNSLPIVESLKIATSLGAINSTRIDVCNITYNELENFDKESINIETIGEKMNTIFS